MPLLEEEVGRLLKSSARTLAVAESCTGGLLGHRITSVSGSTDYFLGGVISYANSVKIDLLGVEESALQAYGAVSEPVARQMACGVRDRLRADIGIGITGIAGPGGGTEQKPVGLVFIGLAAGGGCSVQSYTFDGDRSQVKTAASEAALGMLVEYITD